MNNTAKKLKKDIILLVLHFFISSMVLFLIPVIALFNNKILEVFTGIIFWFGLIFGIIRSHTMGVRTRLPYRKIFQTGTIKRQKHCGAFTIVANKHNIAIYSIFLLGLIVTIMDAIFNFVPEVVFFPVISITLFMFVLHSVFDGIHYKIYKFMKEGNYNEFKNHDKG